MAPEAHKIVLKPTHLCPCGSGKRIAECCLDHDGKLRKRLASLSPTAPTTDYSNPRCYLSSTNDCSDKISREHYISETVLDDLGRLIDVTGAHWMNGETLRVTKSALTAKILCARHNSALSPLDTEAGLFFKILGEIFTDLDRQKRAMRPRLHLVSGEALELWMLKVACGLYLGGLAARDGKPIGKNYSIDLDKVVSAFFQRKWDKRGGLYFNGHVGTMMKIENNISVASLTDDDARLVGGARLIPRGMQFDLIFDDSKGSPAPWTGIIRRPTELVWRQQGREHFLGLTWPRGTPEQSIQMQSVDAPKED
jgi:hypothetical protein